MDRHSGEQNFLGRPRWFGTMAAPHCGQKENAMSLIISAVQSSIHPHPVLIFRRFYVSSSGKSQKAYEKKRSGSRPCPAGLVCFLRRPAAACLSLSRNKLKRAKSPMLQGLSHALVHFGGKQKAPERSPRCPHLHLVHFAPILPGPPAYEFCVFSHERGHRSSVDFTTEK